MPRLKSHNPSYCRHRGSGQAVVTLSGQDFYLGAYGTAASKAEYDRLLGEWLANGRRLSKSPGGTDFTVAEVIARFWEHAQVYYRLPDGSPGKELGIFKLALKPLARLYGRTPAADFGPLALESVRNAMIELGWTRKSVNKQIGRVKHVFKWAVAKELVPPSVHHALSAVAGLRAGRSEAIDREPVKPVSDQDIHATLDQLSSVVAAMVQIQRFTGARPGEVCEMRTADIDTSADVWTYQPRQHKGVHRGHGRTVFIGPKAQEILRPFLLKLNPDAHIFRPADAMAEMRQRRSAARKTPMSCGNRPGSIASRRPKRLPAASYNVPAYRRAIARAADQANRWAQGGRVCGKDDRIVERWHPHQIRHTAATDIRKRFGLEAAQVVLGHVSADITQIYAERNNEAAKKIAAAIG